MSVTKSRFRKSISDNRSAFLDFDDIWPVLSDISFSLVLFLVLALLVQFIEYMRLDKMYREMEEQYRRFKQVDQVQVERTQRIKKAQDRFKAALSSDPFFQTLISQGKLDIRETGDMQEFRFSGDIVFDSGSSELRERGAEIITAFVGFLTRHAWPDLRIEVQGHTDRQPITSGRYKDNWQLSSERALNVVRLFLSPLPDGLLPSITPDRISGIGYGESRPIEDRIDSEINRRIEIRLDYSKVH